ncbi:hypothetical protein CLV84_2649 [Neolewinella xylanilytica]|uniref:Uncharacterized protein n=1 Tax=Neolewinella xylanilytica TaxID=1514080 RepID=A0A2S6I3K2_9BACT|nr:hypothetical protein [Neolewinella xylanilytica]PPK85745.1 hypothetical protein CLV84_2649 [Neolewinella xylanilytica]
MKLIYPISFVVAVLLIVTGAYLHLQLYASSFWTDLMIGGGILLSFAAFAGALLEGKEHLKSA